MNWYIAVLKNYVGFEGRASRPEYWYFTLFSSLIYLALFILMKLASFLGFLYPLYALGVLLPSLAVAVRRLHDTGRSGLWLFIVLVPILGALALLYFMVQPSQGKNEYGAAAN